MLALYPDEQEKVFGEIKSVIKGRVPVCSLYFLTLCWIHIDYLDLRGNASFDLFYSVRMFLQVIDLIAMTKSFSVFYETLRLFPPVRSLPNIYVYWLKLIITSQVPGVAKVATEDTTIVASNIRGEKKAIPILKGTDVYLDFTGTHYNRTYLVFSWCLVHMLIMKCSMFS